MACGRPAVVSETVGCAPDLVEDDRTGYAYPPGDVVALADVLAQAFRLRHAPGLRVALDQKIAIYSLETAADGILGAVQEFAARASGVEPASLAPAI
jgi:glycosyltransferase involved in cell wall biosynthesis